MIVNACASRLGIRAGPRTGKEERGFLGKASKKVEGVPGGEGSSAGSRGVRKFAKRVQGHFGGNWCILEHPLERRLGTAHGIGLDPPSDWGAGPTGREGGVCVTKFWVRGKETGWVPCRFSAAFIFDSVSRGGN